MARFYFATVILLCYKSAFGQGANSVTQKTEWATLYASASVSNKTNLIMEGNARFVDRFQNMQHELIGGLEYSLSRKFSIIPAGYAVVFNYRYGDQPSAFVNNEHRFWQRIQYKNRVGRVLLGNRLALEERSIQRHHLSETGSVLSDGYSNDQLRLRYRVNAVMAIGKRDRAAQFFYLNGWDELCYGWGKYVMHHTPNQNRLFLGVGYQFSKSTSLQAGLIDQWLKKDNGVQTENNLGFMIQFNYAFALIKKS